MQSEDYLGMTIPIIKIGRSRDPIIFIMGIPLLDSILDMTSNKYHNHITNKRSTQYVHI